MIVDLSPDVALLQAIADPERNRILRRLLEGPANQSTLADELGMNSGTVSRHMKQLTAVRLVTKQRSHAPYELVFRDGVWKLLQAVANLCVEIARREAEAAERDAAALNRAGMRAAAVGTSDETAGADRG